MNRLQRLAAAMLLGTVAVSAAWAQDRGVSDKELVLGEVNVLTGPVGVLGYATILGTRLAIAEANAAGGINGRTVRVVSEDDGFVPARTVQAIRKLIDVDQVFAIMTTSSSAGTAAVLPILMEEKTPATLNTSPAAPFFTPPKRYIFVTGQPYQDAAYDMTQKMAAKKPGRWAAIFQDDDFGKDLEIGFMRAIKEQNGPEPLVMRYKRGQTDFSAEVSKIKEAGNIANLFSGGITTENVSIIKEIKLKGIAPAVGMLWTANQKSNFELMGEAGQGVYIYDYVLPLDDPRMAALDASARKYLKPDDYAKLNRYSIAQYMGVKGFLEATRRCGKALTRECVVDQMDKMSGYATGAGAVVGWSPDNHLAKQTGSLQMLDAKAAKLVPVN